MVDKYMYVLNMLSSKNKGIIYIIILIHIVKEGTINRSTLQKMQLNK